ncbi:response regulator [Calditrichota bacterium GD2]
MDVQKILVVDDDEHLRMVLQETLESGGYKVKIASSGNEALAILKEEAFDLLITDLMMPGIKGVELVGRAKEIYPTLEPWLLPLMERLIGRWNLCRRGHSILLPNPFQSVKLNRALNVFLNFNLCKKKTLY